MSRCGRSAALAGAYAKITQFAGGLTEADAMLPSRCAGWTVLDVLYHQLLDARRALVTFASPSPDPPGTDYVTYWRPYAPASGHPAALGGSGAARHAAVGSPPPPTRHRCRIGVAGDLSSGPPRRPGLPL